MSRTDCQANVLIKVKSVNRARHRVMDILASKYRSVRNRACIFVKCINNWSAHGHDMVESRAKYNKRGEIHRRGEHKRQYKQVGINDTPFIGIRSTTLDRLVSPYPRLPISTSSGQYISRGAQIY